MHRDGPILCGGITVSAVYFGVIMRPFTVAILLCVSVLSAATSPAQNADASKPKQPIAAVDGKPIYDEDLAPSIEGQLQPLRNQEYEIKRKALDNMIEQKMLEAAAKKKGLTTEKLLDQEVNSKISDPSDAQLEGYYVGLGRVTLPFAEVKDKLRDAYKQVKIQQARQVCLTPQQPVAHEQEVVIPLSGRRR